METPSEGLSDTVECECTIYALIEYTHMAHVDHALDPDRETGKFYVRELQGLKHCKDVHPRYNELSRIKRTFEREVGAGSVERLIESKDNKMDRELAQRELRIEAYTHRAVLLKSLSLPYWIRYHTTGRIDRVIRSIRIFH